MTLLAVNILTGFLAKYWAVSVKGAILNYIFNFQQECIPVGCVPPACCLYLPACTAHGGGSVPAQGDVPAQEVYLLGVPTPGGCTCPGGCNLPRGVYLPGGWYLPRYSPHCEQNDWTDRCKNITFRKLRLRAVKMASFADLN